MVFKVNIKRLTGLNKFGFQLGGMQITIDPLLPLVVILMAWVLSDRYYPQIMFTQATWIYWMMGIVSSLFLTLSIFIHEYGHALAARVLRLPLERIHLYLFGGMAELKQRPMRPAEELIIALSGPLASFLFAGLAWGMASVTHPDNNEAYLVLQFVFYMNVLLGGFNLLPIFPLDGGRAMRAGLWHFKKYFYRASIMTYHISIVIIIMIMLFSLVLGVTEGISTAFWSAFLAGYLWYTVYSGRDELVYKPDFQDLIFSISDDRHPAAIIRQIHRMDTRYLPNAVIPVTKEGILEHVVMGRELDKLPDANESLHHLYRPVERGYFVDVEDVTTYKPGVKLRAEFLPILKNGTIIGMSDAHEIRFWLMQQKHKHKSVQPDPQQPLSST